MSRAALHLFSHHFYEGFVLAIVPLKSNYVEYTICIQITRSLNINCVGFAYTEVLSPITRNYFILSKLWKWI